MGDKQKGRPEAALLQCDCNVDQAAADLIA
jgi:hypothetical protein